MNRLFLQVGQVGSKCSVSDLYKNNIHQNRMA